MPRLEEWTQTRLNGCQYYSLDSGEGPDTRLSKDYRKCCPNEHTSISITIIIDVGSVFANQSCPDRQQEC